MERIYGYTHEYSQKLSHWEGICARCGHDYFQCLGNCTCLACNGQRQDAERQDASRTAISPDTVIGVVRQRCGHLYPLLSLGSYYRRMSEDTFRRQVAGLRAHSCPACRELRLSKITDYLENCTLSPSGSSEG